MNENEVHQFMAKVAAGRSAKVSGQSDANEGDADLVSFNLVSRCVTKARRGCVLKTTTRQDIIPHTVTISVTISVAISVP